MQIRKTSASANPVFQPAPEAFQVPFVAWLRASVPQLISVVLPKLQTPLADGFMGDVDPALEQQLLHLAVTQREAVIEPDPMADDLAGEAVVLVAFGGQRVASCLATYRRM